MSFLLECPICGERPVPEFAYGGTLGEIAEGTMLDALSEDLYFSDNLAGDQLERWFHRFGCEHWLVVRRDTRTNDISAVWPGAQEPGR